MTSFHVIIPARYHSSRLPGKMLADLHGKSMIQRVYEQAVQSRAASVTIATDHPAVFEAATSFGAAVCLTSPTHQSGTERIAEAVSVLNFNQDPNTVVVNVQGDQPLVSPQAIDLVAEALANQPVEIGMATVCTAINQVEDIFNPHIVKAIRNKQGHAVYFSRAPIPWDRDNFRLDLSEYPAIDLQYYYHHMGLYAYRSYFIQQYLNWEPSPWENIEMLEQLRVLWQGEKIYLAVFNGLNLPEVNTAEDLVVVKKWMEKNQGRT